MAIDGKYHATLFVGHEMLCRCDDYRTLSLAKIVARDKIQSLNRGYEKVRISYYQNGRVVEMEYVKLCLEKAFHRRPREQDRNVK